MHHDSQEHHYLLNGVLEDYVVDIAFVLDVRLEFAVDEFVRLETLRDVAAD